MVLQYLNKGLSKGFPQNLNGYIYILVTKNHLEINGCSEIQDFQIIDQDFPTILKVYNIQLQNIKVHV